MRLNLKKIVKIDRLLAEKYGKKAFKQGTDPLTELVRTVLSQNTNDTNRDRAFESMKTAFPTWENLAAASVNAIATSIKVAGLAKIRAARISKILKAIYKSQKKYNLDFLAQLPDSEVNQYLTQLEGVGPKTAACVMAFSLGRNVMPVDTHVFRVSRRIGIIPSEMNVTAAHEYFAKMRNSLSLYQFHLNLISHGRIVCHARKPACAECVVARDCAHNKKSISRMPRFKRKSKILMRESSRSECDG
jgi:endonuclease-3